MAKTKIEGTVPVEEQQQEEQVPVKTEQLSTPSREQQLREQRLTHNRVQRARNWRA